MPGRRYVAEAIGSDQEDKWRKLMGTVIVAAIVIAAAGFALYTLRKDRRKGGGCSGDCGSCKGCH